MFGYQDCLQSGYCHHVRQHLWVKSEFSETPNQAYFYAKFWFCTRTFPAGDSNLRQFFSADAFQTPENT